MLKISCDGCGLDMHGMTNTFLLELQNPAPIWGSLPLERSCHFCSRRCLYHWCDHARFINDFLQKKRDWRRTYSSEEWQEWNKQARKLAHKKFPLNKGVKK